MPTDAGRDGGGTSESKRRPGAAAVHSRAEFLQYVHKLEATAKMGSWHGHLNQFWTLASIIHPHD